MDKITFLNYLEGELSRLPKVERDKVMYEYEEQFFKAQNKNIDEEDLIRKLGDPKLIAKNIYASSAIKDAEQVPNFKNVLQAIMATLGISFFNIVVVMIPFLIIVLLLLILVLSGSLLILGPIVTFVNIFIYGFQLVDATNIIFSIAFAGLGLMLLTIGLKLIEISYKLILKYLKWCISIILRRTEV